MTSTPTEATAGQWRFIEIAEGQPLPDSFPRCAESALGVVGTIRPAVHVALPRYEGDIVTIYRVEAPESE